MVQTELEKVKRKVKMGFEVSVIWLPGIAKYKNGKRLAEEVVGNTIFIYTEDPTEAVEMVRHGFLEWVFNQHTKSYRELINKLISLFEEQHYEAKEKTVEALMELLR